MAPTGAELAARAKARIGYARVNLDGDLLGRIDETRARLRQALERDKASGESLADKAPQVLQELRELESQATDTATVLKLRALPGEDFDELKRAWPPTPAEWARYKAEVEAVAELAPIMAAPPEVNFAEFMPRLIGLSVIEVDGEPVDWTEQDGLDLWKTLHDGARGDLANEAWNVNNRSSLRPTSGIGTDTTAATDPSSPTPPSEASRSQSS